MVVEGERDEVDGIGVAVEVVVVQDMVDCLGGRPLDGRDGILRTRRRAGRQESNLETWEISWPQFQFASAEANILSFAISLQYYISLQTMERVE